MSQSMGLTSSISMQKGASKSGAPTMMTMDMSQFDSKLKAGRTYIDQGNYEFAIESLKAAEKQKKTAKLYEYLGDAYTADRSYSKAISAYRKAFTLYIKDKNKVLAQKILHTLRYYETPKTKEINKKFEKSLRSL